MRIVPVVLIAAGLVAATTSATAQTATATNSSGLTVERVAQLPSIIGTAPASPTWSPDSRWIAFRWNESGWPFRDVYVVRADGTGLKRLTDMQRTDPAPAPPAGASTDALAAQAAARARGGVSEVQWLPDSRGLLFVSRGSVFRIGVDGGEPQKLGAGDGVSDIALSPDGSSLAFLRDGDIWLWALEAAPTAERLTTLGVEGIGRVPLGTYNRADVEVGTGVWGADWPPFAWSPDGPDDCVPHVRSPAPAEGAVPVLSRRRDHGERAAPWISWRRERAAIAGAASRRYPSGPDDSARTTRRARRSATTSGRRTDACWWIRCPTPAPSDGSSSWIRGRRRRNWCGTIAATRASTRPMSRAGMRTGGAFSSSPTWASAIICIPSTRMVVTPTPVALTSGNWDVAGERGAGHRAGGRPRRRGVSSPPPSRTPTNVTSIAWPLVGSRSGRHQSHRRRARPDRLTRRPARASLVVRRCDADRADGDGRAARVCRAPRDDVATRGVRAPDVDPRRGIETFTNAVDGFLVHARIQEPASLDRTKRHPVDLRARVTRTPCATAGAGSPERCSSFSSSRATSSSRWMCAAASVTDGRFAKRFSWITAARISTTSRRSPTA